MQVQHWSPCQVERFWQGDAQASRRRGPCGMGGFEVSCRRMATWEVYHVLACERVK